MPTFSASIALTDEHATAMEKAARAYDLPVPEFLERCLQTGLAFLLEKVRAEDPDAPKTEWPDDIDDRMPF